jgi:hypothetical protein
VPWGPDWSLQRHLDGALVIRREVLEYCVRHSGPNHPSSLEAKGDLAAILYEFGQDEEAARLEREAFEGARAHLAPGTLPNPGLDRGMPRPSGERDHASEMVEFRSGKPDASRSAKHGGWAGR